MYRSNKGKCSALTHGMCNIMISLYFVTRVTVFHMKYDERLPKPMVTRVPVYSVPINY